MKLDLFTWTNFCQIWLVRYMRHFLIFNHKHNSFTQSVKFGQKNNHVKAVPLGSLQTSMDMAIYLLISTYHVDKKEWMLTFIIFPRGKENFVSAIYCKRYSSMHWAHILEVSYSYKHYTCVVLRFLATRLALFLFCV